MTTAAPLDETTRPDGKKPTWLDNHSGAVAAIAISVAAVAIGLGFANLSRKGWRI